MYTDEKNIPTYNFFPNIFIFSPPMDVGCHVSIAGGLHNAYTTSHEIGATSLQIFTKSPRGRRLPTVDEDMLHTANEIKKQHQLASGMIHSSYLINLAKPYSDAEQERNNMLFDFRIGEALGFSYINVHIGKTAGKYTHTEALQNMYDNITAIIETARSSGYTKPMFVLENTAGQGTEMGYELEELADIVHTTLQDLPVGVCLDTAHLRGAGYNIRDRSGVVDKIEKTLGSDRVVTIHLNDSKVSCGSKRDRHANHGYGAIGYTGLAQVVQRATHHDKLIIHETPTSERRTDEIRNTKRLAQGDTDRIDAYDATHGGSEMLSGHEYQPPDQQTLL